MNSTNQAIHMTRSKAMSRLQGKVAVITGGSSGIGLATAQRFVREGAFVYILGRRQSELDRAAALIGQRVSTVQGDVQSIRDLDRLYAGIREEKGSIDLISSIAAFKGIPKYTSYSATKASVRSFVRTWTAELKDRGIRVNAISPGAIDTPIIDAQAATKEGADAIRASFTAATPLNRLGRPEEIAAAALFLASDESSYVAGADLFVDGGLSAL